VNATSSVKQVYVTCHLVVFKEGSKPELLGTPVTDPQRTIKAEGTAGNEKPVMVQHPALSPSPFAVSGVFTNPQFEVIWRTLAGKDKSSSSVPSSGGADVPYKNIASDVQAVIRMPSVTTRSGQRATLETTREFIYPTEYDKKPSEKTGGKVEYTPKAFETQPLGFVMEMEPVIGPDGYTIDLSLSPQLPAFTGWVEHALADGAKVKQPTFNISKVNTSVTIWDGQTVAFAGEAHIAPFLMDPSLKSEAAVLGKAHPILLFVTARMIDPTGRASNGQTPPTAGKTTAGTGPQTSVVPFRLGPKQFAGPDLIELLEVQSTSSQLEKGDTVIVKGRCRLGSRDEAKLSLSVAANGGENAADQRTLPTVTVKRGIHPFELAFTVPQEGHLKVSLHPVEGGDAIGEVSFGPTEMRPDK
jgi:hypothetical protein